MCKKTGFFNRKYSFCPNVRRCTGMMYRMLYRCVESNQVRKDLAYLGVKLKKTLAITREASSEIYVSQYSNQR